MSVSQAIKSTSCQVQKKVDAFTAGAARVGRGTAAGFLGGLIASWMMNQYQAIESKPVNLRREEERLAYARPKGRQKKSEHAEQNSKSDGDDATVKVAEQVSRKLFDHPLSPAEKKIAGPTVHYGYGALVGALYGGLSELIPSVGMGIGIPYATLLWLFGSETAVPALGLAKPPAKVPARKHASALATHFVYGLILDISRRILRRVL